METQDMIETRLIGLSIALTSLSLALQHYKRACDSGRGAIFFSVARGKVLLSVMALPLTPKGVGGN